VRYTIPRRLRRRERVKALVWIVSFALFKPSQPATLKITEEEVDTVRVELIPAKRKRVTP
jgi:hypothetical protein